MQTEFYVIKHAHDYEQSFHCEKEADESYEYFLEVTIPLHLWEVFVVSRDT